MKLKCKGLLVVGIRKLCKSSLEFCEICVFWCFHIFVFSERWAFSIFSESFVSFGSKDLLEMEKYEDLRLTVFFWGSFWCLTFLGVCFFMVFTVFSGRRSLVFVASGARHDKLTGKIKVKLRFWSSQARSMSLRLRRCWGDGARGGECRGFWWAFQKVSWCHHLFVLDFIFLVGAEGRSSQDVWIIQNCSCSGFCRFSGGLTTEFPADSVCADSNAERFRLAKRSDAGMSWALARLPKQSEEEVMEHLNLEVDQLGGGKSYGFLNRF